MTYYTINLDTIRSWDHTESSLTSQIAEFAKICDELGVYGIGLSFQPDRDTLAMSDMIRIQSSLQHALFQIEGFPSNQFVDEVIKLRPAQVTLTPQQSLSDAHRHWSLKDEREFLTATIDSLKNAGIRTAIVIDPIQEEVILASQIGADRITLNTERYADEFLTDKESAIAPYVAASQKAKTLGLGVNAGGGLSEENLGWFLQKNPILGQVTIGNCFVQQLRQEEPKMVIEKYNRLLRK